jgi:hypothetical protein
VHETTSLLVPIRPGDIALPLADRHFHKCSGSGTGAPHKVVVPTREVHIQAIIQAMLLPRCACRDCPSDAQLSPLEGLEIYARL